MLRGSYSMSFTYESVEFYMQHRCKSLLRSFTFDEWCRGIARCSLFLSSRPRAHHDYHTVPQVPRFPGFAAVAAVATRSSPHLSQRLERSPRPTGRCLHERHGAASDLAVPLAARVGAHDTRHVSQAPPARRRLLAAKTVGEVTTLAGSGSSSFQDHEHIGALQFPVASTSIPVALTRSSRTTIASARSCWLPASRRWQEAALLASKTARAHRRASIIPMASTSIPVALTRSSRTA